MQEKGTLASLSPYVPGKPIADVQAEYGLEKVVKLASNENPFGSSKQVQTALAEALTSLEYYPDGGAKALKKAIANFHQISEEKIVVGSGLDDVIQIISRATLSVGDEIIVADPTFSQYELHATVEGATVIKVPVDSKTGQMDLAGMLAAMTLKTKIIWLCNPNNPTGTYLPQAVIQSFLAQVPSDILVISDEAYQEYVTIEEVSTSLPLLADYPNLIVLRTFSKAYGLAALRIGYAILSEQFKRPFEIVRLPFNTSTLAQVAAITALADQAFIKKTVSTNASERKKWEVFLTQAEVDYYLSQANFVFFDTKQDSKKLAEQLMQSGYIVRAGLRDQWLRVTIGYPEDNQKLRDVLTTIW